MNHVNLFDRRGAATKEIPVENRIKLSWPPGWCLLYFDRPHPEGETMWHYCTFYLSNRGTKEERIVVFPSCGGIFKICYHGPFSKPTNDFGGFPICNRCQKEGK